MRLSLAGLQSSLRVINNSAHPFQCHALLHTYLAVPNISSVAVCGFHNLRYSDKTSGGETVVDDAEEIMVAAFRVAMDMHEWDYCDVMSWHCVYISYSMLC